MEKNLEELLRIKENGIIRSFENNNMNCIFVKNLEELHKYFDSVLTKGKTVGVGGSQTLEQTGLLDQIRKSQATFYDRYEEGLSREDIQNVHRDCFGADVYVTSTNALTTDGCLYNIDGNGNRVAAMIFGPKNVYVVAGLNKVFESEDEAIAHIRNVSAPANAIRLNRKTGCTKVGRCIDCKSPERICSSYVKLAQQQAINRIHVIIIEDDFGY